MPKHCETCHCDQPLVDRYGIPLSPYHVACRGCHVATAKSIIDPPSGLCAACRRNFAREQNRQRLQIRREAKQDILHRVELNLAVGE